MSLPGVHDFSIYAGDTAIKKWQLFRSDGETPSDLTGATIVFQAKNSPFDVEPLLPLKAVMDDARQGAFHLEFPAYTGDLVEAGAELRLVYDMEMRLNGMTKTLVRGALTIVRDITREIVR